MAEQPSGIAGEITFRRPTEADYPAIIRVIDDWWGGRDLSRLLPRLWLQHFTGTSWLAEGLDGRIAGFLIGFLSPDHADTAYCHMIATNPNLRRRGLGLALYERFFADARTAGRSVVKAASRSPSTARSGSKSTKVLGVSGYTERLPGPGTISTGRIGRS
jgi:GNAT superfamily N-acetyltransferase